MGWTQDEIHRLRQAEERAASDGTAGSSSDGARWDGAKWAKGIVEKVFSQPSPGALGDGYRRRGRPSTTSLAPADDDTDESPSLPAPDDDSSRDLNDETTSPEYSNDGEPEEGGASLEYSHDDSSPMDEPDGVCRWCRAPCPPVRSSLGFEHPRRYCSKRCRQTAFRARKLYALESSGDGPKRLGIADPPYPGHAWRYSDQPTFEGEVDHVALLSRLQEFDGWALATSVRALRVLLPLCPEETRIAAWCKPEGVSSKTRGPHSQWEVILYKPARLRRPGVRDFLVAKNARGGGTLVGRKPIAWVSFVLGLLGASPVDELDDLFPGTGVVGRVWRQFQSSRLEERRQLESAGGVHR